MRGHIHKVEDGIKIQAIQILNQSLTEMSRIQSSTHFLCKDITKLVL